MLRNIDLNRISDFLKIVEMGNITRAAEALGEPKAKLSRNLALLEADLGVQLVYRTTRQFQLTEAGLQFFKETKEQMAELEASILGVRNKDEKIEGIIRVTAPEDLGNQIVTGIVSEFKKLHSGAQFDLIYTNTVLNLVKLGVNVAIRVGNLKDSSLIQRKVGFAERVMVASPGYLEKYGQLERIEQLTEHQVVGFSNIEFTHWKLFSGPETKTIKIKPGFIANNFTSVMDLAVRGHGVAYIPRFLADKAMAEGRLVRVLKPWGHKGHPIQVVMPEQKKVPYRIRAFYDFAIKRMTGLFG